jgi:hypothetical protein
MNGLRRPGRPGKIKGSATALDLLPNVTSPERPPGTPPRVAVMTVVRDEGWMIRKWVDHHGRQVGLDNLVVLDDNSSDGSTDDLPCTVHTIPGFPEGRFENARMQLMSGIALGLLAVYDYVAFVDADEFLVPDPARHATLVDLVAAREPQEVIGCMGLNVVHHLDAEPADLDLSRPVLEQRSFAKFLPIMCKPSVKRTPAPWRFSSHGISAKYEVDPELFLLHLKFVDRAHLKAVSDRRRAMVELDGRAKGSTWSHTGDEMTQMLRDFVGDADPSTAPEFTPGSVDLGAAIVQENRHTWKGARPGQIAAMKQQPLVRLPERLTGLL